MLEWPPRKRNRAELVVWATHLVITGIFLSMAYEHESWMGLSGCLFYFMLLPSTYPVLAPDRPNGYR